MANGTYTNTELIESVIVDLNTMLKSQATGQYIQACEYAAQMSQKLFALRKSVDDDLKGKEAEIEELKQAIRSMGGDCIDQSAEEYLKECQEKAEEGSDV